MPRFILPTQFNNPTLPKRPIVGRFFDDFNRADTVAPNLGLPVVGAPWQVINNGSTIAPYITGNALAATAGSVWTLACIDSFLADGRLTLKKSVASGGNIRPAFRIKDYTNFYYVAMGPTGATSMQLSKLVNGSATVLMTVNVTEAERAGEVSFDFIGSTARCIIGGVVRGEVTGLTDFLTETKHGVMLHNASIGDRLDYIGVSKL